MRTSPALSLALTSGCVYTSDETLGQLIDVKIDYLRECSRDEGSDIDTARLLDPRSGYPTARVVEVWTAFETAVMVCLAAFVQTEEPNWSAEVCLETACQIMSDDGALYAYHSLGGAGTGIWDKPEWFADFGEHADEVAERASNYLCADATLVTMVDSTGGGTVESALEDAAYRDE